MYTSPDTVPQSDIVYSDEVKHHLKEGNIFLDEFGMPELNITIPAYAIFLNEARQISIEGKIHQFDYDAVRIFDKDNLRQPVDIFPVERSIRQTDVDKTSKSARSCESVRDNYRLIAYEYHTCKHCSFSFRKKWNILHFIKV